MSRFVLLPGIAFAGLVALMFAVASGGSPATTANAQVPPTATPTAYVPGFPGLLPGHKCSTSLRYLAVGQSATCLVRVNNHADVTADDVTFEFSNTVLGVSNVAYRIGQYGDYTSLPGVVGVTNVAFVPPIVIPGGSGLYVTFTVTRNTLAQGAPRYPIVCADAANLDEVCSQGGVN